MAIVEATIQYVNPAGPGKKYGSIKTSEGGKYLIKKGMESQFQVNDVCKFDVYKETWKDGPVEIVANRIGNGTVSPKQVTRPRANPADSEDILIAVLVKEPRFDDWPPTDILNLLQKHRDVVRMFVNVQRRDDMADEIPY